MRPGTMYVGTTLNGGAAIRKIPFIFNETGTGQSYDLEFGNQYVAFYQNGGVVTSGGPYTIVSPYLQADLSTLKYSQSADIITITHPNYLPYELQRLGPTQWILTPAAFQPQIESPAAVSASGGNAALAKQYYAVSCISDSGEEGFVTVVGGLATGGADAANPVLVSWASFGIGIGTQNAVSFRVYKSAGTAIGVYGYIATTTELSYTDYATLPDFANAPPVAFNPFVPPNSPILNRTGIVCTPGQVPTYAYAMTAVVGGVEGAPTYLYTTSTKVPGAVNNVYYFSWKVVPNATSYRVYRNNGTGGSVYGLLLTGLTTPGVNDIGSIAPNFAINPPVSNANYNPSNVGFSQQRRCFSNTPINPIGFWMSQTGRFSNFNTHVVPVDSDAIFGSLASEEVNQIEHLLELKFMLMLTAGTEIFVQGNGNGVVTPGAVNASTQSQYGSGPLKPIKIGDVLLFNQSLGSFIRDFSFDFVIDGYRGNDITTFASHLFEGYSIVDWAFQKVPDSILWVVRSDGVLLSCTYIREQQILAWARHDFTNGFVENVCAIPENGAYAVYLCIRRVINGSTVRYIERVSSRIWTDELTATYLDCFASFDGRNTTATTMYMSVLSGSWHYNSQVFLNASAPTFASYSPGDQVFLNFTDGKQIRFTIESLNANNVTAIGYPNEDVAIQYQNAPISSWSRAVRTVSGLGYLEGQQVSVWADRFVVGSPFNPQISTVYTVTGGSITLDKPYSVIYVGLPMIADVETLDLDTSVGDSILDTKKNITRVAAYVINTRGIFAGQRNPDNDPLNTTGNKLYELMEKKPESIAAYDDSWPLESRPIYINTPANWNRNGRVFIRQVDPVPMQIIEIVPEGLVATKSQNVRV